MTHFTPRIVEFSTDGIPEKDRIAVWREHYGHVMLRVDMEPAPGHVAALGFDYSEGTPIVLEAKLRSGGDYGVTVTAASPSNPISMTTEATIASIKENPRS